MTAALLNLRGIFSSSLSRLINVDDAINEEQNYILQWEIYDYHIICSVFPLYNDPNKSVESVNKILCLRMMFCIMLLFVSLI